MKAEPHSRNTASTILYGPLYPCNTEPSSLSLPVFNPITDDHFQILFLRLVTDIRKHGIIGYQSCAHIMTVLLEELAVDWKAMLVGELAAKM